MRKNKKDSRARNPVSPQRMVLTLSVNIIRTLVKHNFQSSRQAYLLTWKGLQTGWYTISFSKQI
jgi:hypothetical protein